MGLFGPQYGPHHMCMAAPEILNISMTYLEIHFWAATCPSFWSWRSPLGPQMKWVKLKLSWQHHISQVQKKISLSILALNRTKNFIQLQARKNIYNSLISSHLKFGAIIYGYNTNHKNKFRKCLSDWFHLAN